MGDKKCGHAVAHGDAVCARVCAEGRRANSNAQQADVVHRERHSRARAARGGERREEGGRTDGAHGRRKTTPRTTAVWGRAALRVRDQNLRGERRKGAGGPNGTDGAAAVARDGEREAGEGGRGDECAPVFSFKFFVVEV